MSSFTNWNKLEVLFYINIRESKKATKRRRLKHMIIKWIFFDDSIQLMCCKRQERSKKWILWEFTFVNKSHGQQKIGHKTESFKLFLLLSFQLSSGHDPPKESLNAQQQRQKRKQIEGAHRTNQHDWVVCAQNFFQVSFGYNVRRDEMSSLIKLLSADGLKSKAKKPLADLSAQLLDMFFLAREKFQKNI